MTTFFSFFSFASIIVFAFIVLIYAINTVKQENVNKVVHMDEGILHKKTLNSTLMMERSK